MIFQFATLNNQTANNCDCKRRNVFYLECRSPSTNISRLWFNHPPDKWFTFHATWSNLDHISFWIAPPKWAVKNQPLDTWKSHWGLSPKLDLQHFLMCFHHVPFVSWPQMRTTPVWGKSDISKYIYIYYTLWQTNIDPENEQLLVETNLPSPICQGRIVNSLEGFFRSKSPGILMGSFRSRRTYPTLGAKNITGSSVKNPLIKLHPPMAYWF